MSHAAFQAQRGYDQEPCAGQLVFVDQDGPIWTVECDACRFEAGLPATQASPEMRKLHAAALSKRWRLASGIPAGLRDWTLERLGANVRTDVLAAAKAWAEGESRGLLLTGPAGVGKTTVAAAAANGLLGTAPVRWLSVPVMFARLSLQFNDDERNEILRLLVSPTALVLDDLDKSRPSEYAAEQLFLAIDTRVQAGAPLLVTTNLLLSELADRYPEPYGETIVSRLIGTCDCFAVNGADRRLESRGAAA